MPAFTTAIERQRYCPSCEQNVLARESQMNIAAHTGLILFTCGLWFPFFLIGAFIHAFTGGFRCPQCGAKCGPARRAASRAPSNRRREAAEYDEFDDDEPADRRARPGVAADVSLVARQLVAVLRTRRGQIAAGGMAVLAVLFIGTLYVRSGIQARRRAAEEVARHAAEAERQRIAAEANSKVKKLVDEARVAWIQEKPDRVREMLAAAETVPNATDLKPAMGLRVEMANRQVETLANDAVNDLHAGRVDDATRRVTEALAVQNADELGAAQSLDRVIRSAQDAGRVKAMLVSLPDDEFARLRDASVVPPQLATGYDELDRRVVANLRASYTDAARSRDQQHAAREAEARERQAEADRAHAAAMKKAAEERESKERAAADRRRRAAEEAQRAEEELDSNGLVLMLQTVQASGNRITGSVVNRKGRTLSYAQITFNLYDSSGAQVGSALANINGLEPGGTWKFEATTFGQNYSRYKFSRMSGF